MASSSEGGILDLIDRIYGAAMDRSLWSDTLDAIAEATGGAGATMMMFGSGPAWWGRHTVNGSRTCRLRRLLEPVRRPR